MTLGRPASASECASVAVNVTDAMPGSRVFRGGHPSVKLNSVLNSDRVGAGLLARSLMLNLWPITSVNNVIQKQDQVRK